MPTDAGTDFELKGVAVRFGDLTALDGIDLVVSRGDRIALIGPSGSGKTTLLRLLNGTLRPTSGLVRGHDCDYATAPARRVRETQRRIGTIHQRFDLVDQLRVVHNVNGGRLGSWPLWKAALSLVRPLDTGPVQTALRRVGIEDKLHERTGDLSGGEQQRVAIARVLVQQPRSILADEPIASLDPARAAEIVSLLLEISVETGATLLTSLHDVNVAVREFDRIIGLRAGRLVIDKRTADLHEADLSALFRISEAVRP
jgi:phosphonate transport system ATP-binding protein